MNYSEIMFAIDSSIANTESTCSRLTALYAGKAIKLIKAIRKSFYKDWFM